MHMLLISQATSIFVGVRMLTCANLQKADTEEIRPRDAKMFQRLIPQAMFQNNYCKNTFGYYVHAGLDAIDCNVFEGQLAGTETCD